MTSPPPRIQGNILTYQQSGQPAQLLVDTSSWYAWLATASTFTFQSEQGTFTARKERAGSRRGGEYWKAYRRRYGKLYRAYLGKSEELTLEQLQTVAVALASKGEGDGSLEVPGLGGVTRQSSQAPYKASTHLRRAKGEQTSHEGGLSHPLPSSLPVPLTALIGREQEVRAICDLLSHPEVRLLTITGTGGVGKTRLALEVASVLRADFADGVFFVPLAPVSDPARVMAAIAQAFGLWEVAALPPEEQLQAALRERHLLLVLDNFEQVAATAHQLADLLVSCPRLHLLVTSRAALHLSGEYEFPVPPLPTPDLTQIEDAQALAQVAAVRLFVERAHAIQPAFQLTQANARAIAEICVHLDGLPLAIELAAARIKLLPPQALLHRLSHRLDLLTGGARDLPMRQQTLRNTLQWSYDLLTEPEQRLFRWLSIFVGGCTLEAAEVVCHQDSTQMFRVLDGVASLLDKSLLQQTAHEGEEPRLVVLETIREFGLEQLHQQGEAEAAHRAHARYYLRLSEAAEPHLFGSEQLLWFDRLERERENLRAVLQWAMKGGDEEVQLALRMCSALLYFWFYRRYPSEGRSFLEQGLARGQTLLLYA
jgi:predicted ATPase